MADKPRVAPSLDAAEARDLVHIDGRGQVRHPARLRALAAAYYGVVGTLIAAETALAYDLFGAPGLAIGASLGGLLGWVTHLRRLQRDALTAALDGRLDEAEKKAERILRARLVHRWARPSAYGVLTLVAALRGEHEQALTHAREAVRRWGASRSIQARIARYAEVQALTRCGRLDDAAAKLEELGPEPEGDYLRLTHYTAELAIAFARKRHALSEDALHGRAKFALPITAAAPLLALLAWAFDQQGDDDMAELLLGEARDRHPGVLLSALMPDLERWMTERGAPKVRVEADLDGQADDADAEAMGAEERALRRRR